jgi:hypothetical protein
MYTRQTLLEVVYTRIFLAYPTKSSRIDRQNRVYVPKERVGDWPSFDFRTQKHCF